MGQWWRAVLLVTLLAMAAPARAQDAPDPAVVRARLADVTPLSAEEIGHAIEAINATIARRPFKVTDGTQLSLVDDRARDMLLLVLSGTVAVADLGLKTTATGTVRGLRSPATPPRSEVAANQILWIDVESLVPRRFEFLYDVPGMGDIAYDLIFD
jgi:hypothetical protein